MQLWRRRPQVDWQMEQCTVPVKECWRLIGPHFRGEPSGLTDKSGKDYGADYIALLLSTKRLQIPLY